MTEGTQAGIRSRIASATDWAVPLTALTLAAVFVATDPALAGTCDNDLISKGLTLFDKLTIALPLVGAIYFLYNSFQYGRASSKEKGDYKEARQRVLIWGILVPAAGNIIVKGAVNFMPGASLNCLDSLTIAPPTETVAAAVPVDVLATALVTLPV